MQPGIPHDLEQHILRDWPAWHAEAVRIADIKNRAGSGPRGTSWTTADVLFLALRLGLDELTNRHREDSK